MTNEIRSATGTLPPGSNANAGLAGCNLPSHCPGMFVVSEAEAAAIRDILHERGELAAAAELRRLFLDRGIQRVAQRRQLGFALFDEAQPFSNHFTRRSPLASTSE
jgi:hypothetical protein